MKNKIEQMKFITLFLLVNVLHNFDAGYIGRYEVVIKNEKDQSIHAFITVATYDELESAFESNEMFKSFLFNLQGYSQKDSLDFYKQFYYVDYPVYKGRKEKLVTTLETDRIRIAKSDVKELRYISFKKTNFLFLQTQFNLEEIKLFQSPPEYIDLFSIDPEQEGMQNLWVVSYNPDFTEAEIKQILNAIRRAYRLKRTEDDWIRNSYVYERLFEVSEKKLRVYGVYLVRVVDP